MAVTPQGLLLVGGQQTEGTLGGRGLVPAAGVITRKRRQSGFDANQYAKINELMGYDLQQQQEAKAAAERQNRVAQSIGDLEMIYFDNSTNSYQPRFGADLPEGFERTRAYDCVAELNGQIIMILNTNFRNQTRILQTDLSMEKVEAIKFFVSPRTNPSVFRYQNKIYVVGGTYQLDGASEATDFPVAHNVIYFKSSGKVHRVQIVDQVDLQQDRYSSFIFPEGEFTQWSEWSSCSVSCGGGLIQRERRCVNLFVELVDEVGVHNLSSAL